MTCKGFRQRYTHPVAGAVPIFSALLLLLFYCNFTKVQASRYCGDNLSQALALVCDGKYYEPFPDPGSTTESITTTTETSTEESPANTESSNVNMNAGDLVRAKLFPSNGNLKSRCKRGIVDECCHSDCTIDTLRSYCKVG